jgi:hypothetical protein
VLGGLRRNAQARADPEMLTLYELAIESFFPADANTATYLRETAGDDRS